MANGDTKTEAMLNVLGNGGTGDEFRGCCNTKTQSYILDAIDRINSLAPGGSSDFNDLENRPQLNGVAMTGSTDITDFVGTDGTSAGEQGLVPAPTAADADKFLKSDGTWATAGGGGGGIRTLDENDLEGNSYRLYHLPTGLYICPKTNPNHTVYVSTDYDFWCDDQLAIVNHRDDGIDIIFFAGTFGTWLFREGPTGATYERGRLVTERGLDSINTQLSDLEARVSALEGN